MKYNKGGWIRMIKLKYKEKDLVDDYEFRSKPYFHQLNCFRLSRERESFALFFEMGCGKSKVVVDNITWLHREGKITGAIITAPKGAYFNWGEIEIPKHMPEADLKNAVVVHWSSSARRMAKRGANRLFDPDIRGIKILVMNIEALSTTKGYKYAHKFLYAHSAIMVVDESTSIKRRNSNRTKAALKLAQFAKYRRILSGLPNPESPLDLWSQLEFLDGNILGYSSFYSFRNHFAILKRRHMNGRSFDQVIGFQRLDELNGLISPHVMRVMKKDCLDLPPKIFQRRDVPLSPELAKIYRNLRDQAMVELSSEVTVTAPLVITRIIKLQQVLCNFMKVEGEDEVRILTDANPRIAALLDTVEEIPDKVVIWVNFTKSLEDVVAALHNRYGEESYVTYHGATTPDQRVTAVKRFQNPSDPCRFFIGNLKTGGMGLTLTAAASVIYYQNSWSYELRAQSEDRTHRIGQGRSVTYVDLVTKSSIDEKMLNMLTRKQNLASTLFKDPKSWQDMFSGNLDVDDE